MYVKPFTPRFTSSDSLLRGFAPTLPGAEGYCWAICSCRVRQFIARKAPDGCLIA